MIIGLSDFFGSVIIFVSPIAEVAIPLVTSLCQRGCLSP